jgi:hypothetical protein
MMAGQGPDWYACLNQVPANGDVFIDSVVGMTRDWDKDQCFTGAMNYGCGCDTPEIQDPIQEYLAAASAAQTMDERKEALGGLQLQALGDHAFQHLGIEQIGGRQGAAFLLDLQGQFPYLQGKFGGGDHVFIDHGDDPVKLFDSSRGGERLKGQQQACCESW